MRTVEIVRKAEPGNVQVLGMVVDEVRCLALYANPDEAFKAMEVDGCAPSSEGWEAVSVDANALLTIAAAFGYSYVAAPLESRVGGQAGMCNVLEFVDHMANCD